MSDEAGRQRSGYSGGALVLTGLLCGFVSCGGGLFLGYCSGVASRVAAQQPFTRTTPDTLGDTPQEPSSPALTFEQRGSRQRYSICHIDVEARAERGVGFTSINMFALDQAGNVLGRSLENIEGMSAGQTRMLEFSFTETRCEDIKQVRWEFD